MVADTNNPGFDEKFSFELLDDDVSRRLYITVWNTDKACRSGIPEFLGAMSFGLRHILTESKRVDGWYYLLEERAARKKHVRAIVRRPHTDHEDNESSPYTSARTDRPPVTSHSYYTSTPRASARSCRSTGSNPETTTSRRSRSVGVRTDPSSPPGGPLDPGERVRTLDVIETMTRDIARDLSLGRLDQQRPPYSGHSRQRSSSASASSSRKSRTFLNSNNRDLDDSGITSGDQQQQSPLRSRDHSEQRSRSALRESRRSYTRTSAEDRRVDLIGSCHDPDQNCNARRVAVNGSWQDPDQNCLDRRVAVSGSWHDPDQKYELQSLSNWAPVRHVANQETPTAELSDVTATGIIGHAISV